MASISTYHPLNPQTTLWPTSTPSAPNSSLTPLPSSYPRLRLILEAAPHILNLDLPIAHFPVRTCSPHQRMKGIFLHRILHRVEGDYDNARRRDSDVKDNEIYRKIWGVEG